MIPAENIEGLIKNLSDKTSAKMDQLLRKKMLHALAESEKPSALMWPNIRRIIMKSPIAKLAAATLIIAAALIAILQSGSWMDRAIPAYTDVLGNVWKHKTLTWKVTIPDKAAITQAMALEPYYVKVVWACGKVWLLDRRERKVILMNPAKKTAKIMFIEDQPPDIYETLSDFKNMPQLSTEQIGQRQIGEIQAIGFDASIGHDQATVWVDPQTQLPIRIEFFGTNECGRTEPEFIWSDIVFDVELDESLFKFDLAGYEVEEVDSG